MEHWKEIEGYEGLYQVSDLGNVKSLNYNHTGKEELLKPANDGRGYLFVHLCKDGKRRRKHIHRLAADAFIPNPNKYEVVHHIDHNPSNNIVVNLVWTDKQEHNEFHADERAKKQEKTVFQYTLDGEFVAVWTSAKKAAKQLNFTQNHISDCCNNKIKQHKGYRWSFVPL